MADSHQLYLIRHAESAKNLERHLIGGRSNETPLTPTGVAQARICGGYLLSRAVEPDEIHASPAVRTLATAEGVLDAMGLRHMPIRVDDRLQELSQGECEGMLRDDVYTPEVLAQIDRQQMSFRLRGGESMNDVAERMRDWLVEWTDRHRQGPPTTALIFTHGLAKRCLLGLMLGWDHGTIYRTEIPNASVTELVYGARGWEIGAIAVDAVRLGGSLTEGV